MYGYACLHQYLPFQSFNSNTRVEGGRFSRLIKKTLARQESIVVVHLLGKNKLHKLLECFYDRVWKSKLMPAAALAVF